MGSVCTFLASPPNQADENTVRVFRANKANVKLFPPPLEVPAREIKPFSMLLDLAFYERKINS